MAYLNWDINNIKNSDFSDSTKKILESEMNKAGSERKINYFTYLREHINNNRSVKHLNKALPKLTETTFNFLEQSLTAELFHFNLSQLVTPEALLQSSMDFYAFIHDPELLSAYFKYLQTQSKNIRIQKNDESNPACSSFKGRCIASKASHEIYLSYYIHNNLDDYPTFMHETGHLLAALLYLDKMNPIIERYFLELPGYFTQIIAIYYYSIRMGKPEVFNLLINNLIADIYKNAIHAYIHQVVMKHLFKPSVETIEKELESLGYKGKISNVDSYIIEDIFIKNDILNSFLIAFDLFINNKNDHERAFSEYKQILLSKNDDIMSLLKQHKITYFEDGCENVKKQVREIHSMIQ